MQLVATCSANGWFTVVSPHQLKHTNLRGSCTAHCLFQSLATLNLVDFQNHGILNVFYHVIDRIWGLGYAMLATKAWNKYRGAREPLKIVCFNRCGDTTVTLSSGTTWSVILNSGLTAKDRPGSLFQPGPGPGPGSAKNAGTGILPGPGL